MIKANYLQSSIRLHGTSNRKFYHSNHFIPQKNSPAYTTDAVLRKHRDASARCIRFGPYFNNGNQNPFYIENDYDYYRECLGNQATFTVGIYRRGGGGGGRTPPAHTMHIPKSGKYNGKQHIVGLNIACM